MPFIVKHILRWTPLAILTGILAGCASAILLASLEFATNLRESHHWLIALLPVAGLAVGCMYHYFGRSVEAGNNLLLEEIHAEVESPRRTIPFRMTPFILIGTFLTHLFGGSAGREGTALQTAASLADQLGKPFRLTPRERRILLMAGISAGFASVFGTPLAGFVFGLEVLAIGSLTYEAIFPCLLAAFVADLTCSALPIHHTIYNVASVPPMSPLNLLYAALAGAAFGLAAMLFARLTHAIGGLFKRYIDWPPLRPFIGGAIVALAVFALHSTRYIGLGVPIIVAAFHGPLPPWDWLAKILFTAVTLGAAFKGGEVTPLFFIGATLGNALAWLLPLPPSLLAGMGFAAVFAGAANTPIASTLLAIELFGAEAGAYAAIACVLSYLCSGHAGIYRSQRLHTPKHGVS
jgi:H+/Cl- antiporter ClcA